MSITIGKQDKVYKQYALKKIDEFNKNGKRTIVHFSDTYYPIIDGVIKVVENYAKILSDKFNIVLIVPKHKNKSVIDKTDHLVIATKGLFLSFVNYDIATPFGDPFLKTVFKKLNISLVHSHSPFTLGKLGYKLAKKKKVPFLMTLHSQYKQDFLRYAKVEWFANLLLKGAMKVFNKSDEVWTMHSKTKKVVQDYGYKGNVHLVPNATDFYVDNIGISLEQMKENINKTYNLSPNIPVFLFVGRIMAQKNIHFLVDALKILDNQGLDFKMFFVGNGPDEKALYRQIERLGLKNKVILAGRIDDKEQLACFYARANLFLFPSYYDTSSLVQIEASALFTPSVLLEDSATSLTVTDKVNGYISKNSTKEYAQTILDAIGNKAQLEKVCLNAHNDLYVTWEMLAPKIQERYNYLIDKKSN